MKNTVFIHTNAKQIAGAVVSAHSLKRNSADPDAFEVKILKVEDHDFFKAYEGRKFLRAKGWRTWKNDDLQSFTPTRFMPPELMGYKGRAVVIDPDVFAVGDINELFEKDMGGAAIGAKPRPGHNGRADYVASSVMLLECEKLQHWKVKEQFDALFEGTFDYDDWITLTTEPEGSICHLESIWNDFDNLTPQTRLLHNTKRRTQPWKTGLPIDFRNRIPLISKFLPENGIVLPGRYKKHPDPRQEALFFSLLKECLDKGLISESEIKHEMASNHVRHDALEVMARVPDVDSILNQKVAA